MSLRARIRDWNDFLYLIVKGAYDRYVVVWRLRYGVRDGFFSMLLKMNFKLLMFV